LRLQLGRTALIILFITAMILTMIACFGCTSSTDASDETDGKPVIIDFWRPGCPPCDVMEPIVEELKEEYGDQVDFKAYNTLEERGKVDQYGITAVPTFLFINAAGEIVDKVVGQTDIETMRSKIEALLASP
jgi:thioredoxin 1